MAPVCDDEWCVVEPDESVLAGAGRVTVVANVEVMVEPAALVVLVLG